MNEPTMNNLYLADLFEHALHITSTLRFSDPTLPR